jgi:hypothetical protein
MSKGDLKTPIADQSNEGNSIIEMALNIDKPFVPSPLDIQRMIAQIVFECQNCGVMCLQCDLRLPCARATENNRERL